jgi:hypothetical protein
VGELEAPTRRGDILYAWFGELIWLSVVGSEKRRRWDEK